MKTETYTLEILTPCFCAGAKPETAEIRASSIRGQLRWWFRVLGGFKSMAPKTLRQQENEIFGSVSGDQGRASKLVVRVVNDALRAEVKDSRELGHKPFSNESYLTFPIQSKIKGGKVIDYNGRGVFLSGTFSLSVQWRGEQKIWESIQALIVVFKELGSLGFRGRRAMGALAGANNQENAISLSKALEAFQSPSGICIKYISAKDSRDCISKLGGWLREWRAHGRTQDHQHNRNDHSLPPYNKGFAFAKRDHDIGYNTPSTEGLPTFRPALGLPIIQRTQQRTINWEKEFDQEKARRNPRYKGDGRFASPVILRPHRDAAGQWRALVIFVDALKWDERDSVFLNGSRREVSLDLYNAMKTDGRLLNYP